MDCSGREMGMQLEKAGVLKMLVLFPVPAQESQHYLVERTMMLFENDSL